MNPFYARGGEWYEDERWALALEECYVAPEPDDEPNEQLVLAVGSGA